MNLEPAAKKGLVFLACLGFVIVLLAIYLFRYGNSQVTSQYKKQLALAKAEGMIVDDVGLASYNPRVPDSENAALIYGQIKPSLNYSSKVKFLIPQTNMDAKFREELRREIKDSEANIALVERAVQKEKCWVDLSSNPETNPTGLNLSNLRDVVEALKARGVVAKMRGDNESALKDFRTIEKVVRHIYMTKISYGSGYAESMTRDKAAFVAAWAAELPPGSIWHKEFAKLTKEYVVQSRRELIELDLYEDLQASEATRTREQRAKVLGFKDSEEQSVSPLDFASPSGRGIEASLVKIIKGRRMIWDECAKEDLADPLIIRQGESLVTEGTRANPWLEKWRSMRHERYSDNSSEKYQRLAMQAALRVLDQEDRSKVPSMAGLDLPLSAKPPMVSMRPDGIHVTVTTSGARRLSATFIISTKPN